ncbi:MAG: hypothetical protein O3B24_11550 [Verrucomicrobia bacterium]|nr:hypothetical protein [Verrucomicrobiota bacterium]
MLEYVLITLIMLTCVAVLAVLMVAVREQGSRTVELVASDYP